MIANYAITLQSDTLLRPVLITVIATNLRGLVRWSGGRLLRGKRMRQRTAAASWTMLARLRRRVLCRYKVKIVLLLAALCGVRYLCLRN